MRPIRTTLSNKNLINMGVPKALLDLSLEDLDLSEKILDYVQGYIDNIDNSFKYNKGLFLYGSNGTGKTSIASIIIKEAYKHRYTAKRMTWVDYMTLYTRAWGCNNFELKMHTEDVIKDIKDREFLVLEEIGKEQDNKLAMTLLEDLLRHREDKGFPTIICTNLAPKSVVERYGASIESLIKGNMTPIKLVGKDNRKE
ncbi:MAG: AAA family ATPase [Clostridia bacterium]|jgi:DNA replication protein DnaC